MIKPTLLAILSANAINNLTPPVAYDYEPTQPFVVQTLPIGQLRPICAEFTKNIYGCAHIDTNRIYIRANMPSDLHDLILRHEKAHLNGWKHD